MRRAVHRPCRKAGTFDDGAPRARKRMMGHRTHNLVTGRQLRAARTLAGMSQADLAFALDINERAIRFWELRRDKKPTSGPNNARIEQCLFEHGVVLFAEPTPGARLAENTEKH
jgi:DNA-binding transcriptional regulator YiaG